MADAAKRAERKKDPPGDFQATGRELVYRIAKLLRHDLDILGALAFGAIALVVRHRLTLIKGVVGSPLDGRRMEKDISVISLDESKPLVGQFLNRTV